MRLILVRINLLYVSDKYRGVTNNALTDIMRVVLTGIATAIYIFFSNFFSKRNDRCVIIKFLMSIMSGFFRDRTGLGFSGQAKDGIPQFFLLLKIFSF